MLLHSILVGCQQDFNLDDRRVGQTGSSVGETGFPPAPGPFVDVAVDFYQACAARRDAAVVCWGDGGAHGPTTSPETVLTDVALATSVACGLDLDRHAVCWGRADFAETPAGEFDVIELGTAACVLAGQEVTCWGSDSSGTVSRDIGPVKALSVNGAVCSVGLDDLVTCWGNNEDGQATPPSTPMRAVRAGSTGTSCGVDLEGEAVCWGANRSGTALAPPGPYTVVDAGVNVTCGLHEGGTLECWGDVDQPLAHPPEGTYSVLSVEAMTACAITTDGALECWGDDGSEIVSSAPSE